MTAPARQAALVIAQHQLAEARAVIVTLRDLLEAERSVAEARDHYAGWAAWPNAGALLERLARNQCLGPSDVLAARRLLGALGEIQRLDGLCLDARIRAYELAANSGGRGS